MNAGRVDVTGAAAAQAHVGKRSRECDQVRRTFAQVVAGGQHARQVDEARARRVDLAVRADDRRARVAGAGHLSRPFAMVAVDLSHAFAQKLRSGIAGAVE